MSVRFNTILARATQRDRPKFRIEIMLRIYVRLQIHYNTFLLEQKVEKTGLHVILELGPWALASILKHLKLVGHLTDDILLTAVIALQSSNIIEYMRRYVTDLFPLGYRGF